MATRKQNSTSSRIILDKAQAKMNRTNEAYKADPDDTRKLNSYRKAKAELAEARRVHRLLRIDEGPTGDGDAIAEVVSIGAGAAVPRTG